MVNVDPRGTMGKLIRRPCLAYVVKMLNGNHIQDLFKSEPLQEKLSYQESFFFPYVDADKYRRTAQPVSDRGRQTRRD